MLTWTTHPADGGDWLFTSLEHLLALADGFEMYIDQVGESRAPLN